MNIAEIVIAFMAIICAFVIGWSKRKQYVIPAIIIYVATLVVMALTKG